MNWKEIKERVDTHLQGLGVDEEMVEIEWIDITCCDAEDLEITVSQGSDDRVEMTISD